MRTIGIDLAITGAHHAVIVDGRGEALGRSFRFTTDPADLAELLRRTRAGVGEDEPLRVVMEPTGLSWLPIASFCIQRGVRVYLVNTQQVADLRKFYSKHAKSDRISARVLARLPGSTRRPCMPYTWLTPSISAANAGASSKRH
jgi:transposase